MQACCSFLRLLTGKKALLNKTPALTKSMNMGIWVAVTSNQLFLRCSYTELKFSKNKVVTAKTPFFAIGSLCTPHSVYLNIGFLKGSLFMEILRFQSYYFQLKNATPVFSEWFTFFRTFVS